MRYKTYVGGQRDKGGRASARGPCNEACIILAKQRFWKWIVCAHYSSRERDNIRMFSRLWPEECAQTVHLRQRRQQHTHTHYISTSLYTRRWCAADTAGGGHRKSYHFTTLATDCAITVVCVYSRAVPLTRVCVCVARHIRARYRGQ